MKKAKTPKAPNYSQLTNQQAELAKQAWKEQTAAGRPDQFNPEGSMTWEQDPTTGEWTQTVAMSPERQALYDTTTGKAQQAMDAFTPSQVDLSGVADMPEVGGYDQRVIDTMRALRAPQLARDRAAQEQRMTARGIGMGTGSAWNTEQANMGDRENRADMEAVLAGIQEGNTDFGQGMQLRQQGVNEAFRLPEANQQLALGMLGGANSFRMPTFNQPYTPGQSGTVPDLVGAANSQYQAAIDKANAKNSSGIGGMLGGLAGNALGSFLGPMGSAVGGQIGKSLFS